jgi:SNF2 family DNA or RNA helicase
VKTEFEKQKHYRERFGKSGSHVGALHQTNWLRVILDEGHFIKTHDRKIARACHNLNAQHYWIMSGTPLVNSIGEVFSYFKFFHMDEVTTFDEFRKVYGHKTEAGKRKLNKKIHQFMIRRTYATRLMGSPIVKLPIANEFVQKVRITPVSIRCFGWHTPFQPSTPFQLLFLMSAPVLRSSSGILTFVSLR